MAAQEMAPEPGEDVGILLLGDSADRNLIYDFCVSASGQACTPATYRGPCHAPPAPVRPSCMHAWTQAAALHKLLAAHHAHCLHCTAGAASLTCAPLHVHRRCSRSTST